MLLQTVCTARVKQNKTLLYLNLSQAGITATDSVTARSLTKMLLVNESLIHLDLSNNAFSDSGAYCIFEGLEQNKTLIYLNLSQAGITATDPDTARSLTKMLLVNKSLTNLDLSGNTFSDSGAYCIFECLQHNETLIYLNLSQTGITATDPATGRSLTKMLQENKSLTHLDLSENRLSDSGAYCIFEGLEHNTVLRDLNLFGVLNITDNDVEHIARVLKCNRSLQMLNIYDCSYLGHYGIRLILDSLMFNSTLQKLLAMCVYSQKDLSAFNRKRAAKKLPFINIALSYAYTDGSDSD